MIHWDLFKRFKQLFRHGFINQDQTKIKFDLLDQTLKRKNAREIKNRGKNPNDC